MEHLTTDTFKDKVFDYEREQEWKFNGNKPAVIDFYADWCQPCKVIAPVLEQLSKEYDGRVDIYKVDTEDQPEIAAAFGIRSIPSLLFIPADDSPQMAIGALPKETFEKIFKDVLKVD